MEVDKNLINEINKKYEQNLNKEEEKPTIEHGDTDGDETNVFRIPQKLKKSQPASGRYQFGKSRDQMHEEVIAELESISLDIQKTRKMLVQHQNHQTQYLQEIRDLLQVIVELLLPEEEDDYEK